MPHKARQNDLTLGVLGGESQNHESREAATNTAIDLLITMHLLKDEGPKTVQGTGQGDMTPKNILGRGMPVCPRPNIKDVAQGKNKAQEKTGRPHALLL